jgi:hypothetical protein
MGKSVYLINAFFGLLVGFLVAVFAGIYPIAIGRFGADSAGWLIGGIVAMAFGYYQLKKYRAAK